MRLSAPCLRAASRQVHRTDRPEAAVGVGLHETALGAEAMKVDRAALAAIHADCPQTLKPYHFRQTALAAFAPNLVFDSEVLLAGPGRYCPAGQ